MFSVFPFGRILAALIVIGLFSSSGQVCSATPPPNPKLTPVVHPDLTGLEELVREQLQEARGELTLIEAKTEVTDEQLSQAYGRLGKLYHAYEMFESAKSCYLNAESLSSGAFPWPYYLALAYQRMGDLESATQSYLKALEADPSYMATLLRLGDLEFSLDRIDTAQRLFEGALRLHGSSAAAMVGLGRVSSSRNDPEGAIKLFEQALTLQPEAANIHYSLAMAYRKARNTEKARAHLEKSGPQKPEFPDPLNDELEDLKTGKYFRWLRGVRAFSEGRFEDAASEYRKMVEADPSEPMAWMDLGSTMLELGKIPESIEQFREALRLSPGNSRAHYNLGIAHTRLGSDREAALQYEAAVQSRQDFKDGHFHLANVLMRLGQDGKALSHYERVVALEPSNGFARLMQAMALVRLKRHTEAKARLEDGLAAIPDDPDMKHALARLLVASPDQQIRDGNRALQLMQSLIANPQSVDLEHVETLAMLSAELGQFDKAAGLQKKMISQAQAANLGDLAQALKSNLEQYEVQRPCRLPWRDDDPVFSPVAGSQVVLGPGADQARAQRE